MRLSLKFVWIAEMQKPARLCRKLRRIDQT